ncbi:MAG: LysE family translocator [Actinomycetota bacterium]|nr:LysE family translocator [Actinomycetota bacterium]
MTETALLGWVVVAFLGVMTPGIDTMLVLRYTVLGGRPAGLWVVVGIAAGSLGWATASLAGLTALLAASRLAYDAVRIAGAAYLIWLGASAIWKTLTRHGIGHIPGDTSAAELEGPSPTRGLRTGLVTNLLNPKVGVFSISLLPQFLPTGPGATARGALLVAIHLATTFLWYPTLILAIGQARRVLLRPAMRRWARPPHRHHAHRPRPAPGRRNPTSRVGRRNPSPSRSGIVLRNS